MPRVIPSLLIQADGLVKTVSFKDPKYVGDPINAVKIFNEKEADELIVFDIDATTHGREPNFRLIGQLAAECRMPLCYGGGVTTVAHAKHIISLGVEKVAISSAAVLNPSLISQIAHELGTQSVVVVLDVKTSLFGKPEVWTHNARKNTGRSPIDLASQSAALGAGEIVINSIDRDGQMNGYDLNLIKKVRDVIRLPLTFLGGAGSLGSIAELFETCGIVGAAAGSLFVFKGPYRAVLINYPSPKEKEKLFHRLRQL